MSVIKDANGKISFSRITGAVIVVANLGIGVIAAWKGNSPVIADIPANWAMLVGALYGLNVIGKKVS
jgi:hypothetical protein